MPKPDWTNLPAPAIRKAAAADLPAVMGIEREQFSNPWPAEHFRAELANSFSNFYVLEGGNPPSLAGFLIFWRLDDELELHKIAVAKTCLRRGYGSCLMEFFLHRARSWHCRQAVLEVRAGNETAIGFYEKYAFQPIGRRRDYYSSPSEDALVFRLIF